MDTWGSALNPLIVLALVARHFIVIAIIVRLILSQVHVEQKVLVAVAQMMLAREHNVIVAVRIVALLIA